MVDVSLIRQNYSENEMKIQKHMWTSDLTKQLKLMSTLLRLYNFSFFYEEIAHIIFSAKIFRKMEKTLRQSSVQSLQLQLSINLTLECVHNLSNIDMGTSCLVGKVLVTHTEETNLQTNSGTYC